MNILVAGDFCPQMRVAKAFEEQDYKSVIKEVKDITSKADYSIVNFECAVTKGGEQAIKKQGPNLCCSIRGIEAVKWAGFDCVTIANNHVRDFGDEGMRNILDACANMGIDTVGGGENLNDASKILYKNIKGNTLAVINCCEHEFSVATYTTAGSNPLNPVQQWYAIQEAKNKADRILVIVHGGHEHWQLPSLRMKETYRFFIDAGADAVVNHHQHCYNGYEIYQGKPIFYGLGNFCFDGNRSKKDIWHEGFMVTIDFSDAIPSFELHPYRQCAEEPCVKLLPQGSFDERLKELNDIIADAEKLQNAIDNYYVDCEETYSNLFEPIRNRYYLGAKRRGWLPSFISKKRKVQAFNFINCESHRDKLLFWLKKYE